MINVACSQQVNSQQGLADAGLGLAVGSFCGFGAFWKKEILAMTRVFIVM